MEPSTWTSFLLNWIHPIFWEEEEEKEEEDEENRLKIVRIEKRSTIRHTLIQLERNERYCN